MHVSNLDLKVSVTLYKIYNLQMYDVDISSVVP